jgi:hypothetical protein
MMSRESFINIVNKFVSECPGNWRLGQKVFNVVDSIFHVSRELQKRGQDCFFTEDPIEVEDFIDAAYQIYTSDSSFWADDYIFAYYKRGDKPLEYLGRLTFNDLILMCGNLYKKHTEDNKEYYTDINNIIVIPSERVSDLTGKIELGKDAYYCKYLWDLSDEEITEFLKQM